jgi:metallo-beta-lactamase family protein
LYTRAEAENALKHLKPLAFRKKLKLCEETYITLIPAGHILGATFVQVEHYGKIVLFSGDLGRPDDPIMQAPSVMQAADYLVVESTYGDRLHHRTDPMDELAEMVTQTAARGGTVLIPAFAVGRAQHLLYLLYQLKCANRIPNIPVYLDSPMARDATDVFCKYSELHRLSADVARRVCEAATIINSKEESQALDVDPHPKVIVSASGMLEGGRVMHHFRVCAPDPKNTILFSGFQAPGTRGAEIVGGKEEIRLFGETIPVRATIKMLNNMSAHADYSEILGWLKNFNHTPRRVFITHGEAAAAHALKEKIHTQYGWQCTVPDFMQEEFLA